MTFQTGSKGLLQIWLISAESLVQTSNLDIAKSLDGFEFNQPASISVNRRIYEANADYMAGGAHRSRVDTVQLVLDRLHGDGPLYRALNQF